MTRNSVRKALIERKMTIGTWIQAGHPTVAEVLADVGFDWIAVDCEHTGISVGEFANLLCAMDGRGSIPMVRVRENDTLAIRQVLDMGAQGIIVPLINTPKQAERAVRAAKYPPQGIRGYAFTKSNNWGRTFSDYAAHANDDIAVVVMIESKEGVKNIHSILAVDGVDGVFVGPYDMSGSYGIVGQINHQTIQDACSHIVIACEKAGKSAGIHVVDTSPEAISKAVESGFTFIAVGIDTVFIREGAAAALAIARSAANGA